MRIRFLFINAIDAAKGIETLYPPLGIGYMCSSLRARFGSDAIEFKVIYDRVEDEINRFKPDIIGISAVSQNYGKAVAYAAFAKRYDIPVICGGVHISSLPLSITKEMDIGVVGEGEDTICDTVELFLKKRRFAKGDLKAIKGIIYRDDAGDVVFTGDRGLISPIDRLSYPARDLLDINQNTYMFTSRGCPYRCVFCASSRFWNEIRFFSSEYVVNEIEHLKKEYDVKRINLYDDLFAINIPRIKEILRLLRERGLSGKIDFSCAIRANLVNDEVISILKEIGVKNIGVGLESGSDRTLKYLKQDVKIGDNENAIRIIKKHGITVHGSFIIGSPEETKEDILETFNFIKSSRLEGFTVYPLTPFPGTPVWEYARSKGLVSERMDWEKLNVNFDSNYGAAIILSEKLTREEIYKLFLKFKRYAERRQLCYLIGYAVSHPFRLLAYLFKKIRGLVKR